ncbi:MAG: M1 family metallopeptidase [Ardenticatenaceae bacterium]|nr:M1 family metallopeptidase [Ardenticatenaceae bacterium]MCB9445621.1 M1 family metallopeptidase [Ardenticatenaceae bacterium]
MKRFLANLTLLFVLAALPACRLRPESVPPAMTPTVPPIPTAVDVVTAVPTPTATIAPSHTAQPGLPVSTVFDNAWDDREPFRAGLIDDAQPVLQQLPGASIYHLDLQIRDTMTQVSGVMDVRYTNQEAVELDAIYFHLYPNLLGGKMNVDDVLVNDTAVSPTLEENNTILRVPLAETLQPGRQVVIHLAFTTDVPTEVERNYGVLAYLDGVLALAHFYPMIGAYDETGWHLEPAPESGDVVYADSSFFLVRVTAPAEQVVVTSGIEVSAEENGGERTAVIAAGPMRDFYLAASPDYKPITTTAGQTIINSYYTTGLETGAAIILDTAAAAAEIYGNRFGIYPFTEMDLVNTPNLALGIEYPGMMAITSRIYDPDGFLGNVPNSAYIEGTTAHEVGHQWFYSVVGNDQLDEPWLDESLTQYITWLYFRDRYGDEAAEGFFQSFQDRWDRVDSAATPIGLPVSAYEGAAYSGIIYGRGPIFVRELAATMGEDVFDAFLQDYYRSHQWGTANTADFLALAESHCNCQLDSLFAAQLFAK